ncbi:acyl-CoA dehydrogenase, partial [Fulvivirga sp. RKSG066]|nr:acyl-CoA dehydrogenase [Fulvivirga aurantia]
MKTTQNSTNPDNRVLSKDYRPSKNFHTSDLIWQEYAQRKISKNGWEYMQPIWDKLGAQAAEEMDQLSMDADKNGPELVKRDFWGEDIEQIKFHPAYDRLLEIAVESQMFRVKWEPSLRSRFKNEKHSLGFGSGYLFAMAEMGQYCPLCMTDGVARLIDRFANEGDKKRLLPRIATKNPDELYTGAMFLTEKAGGSDVG